MAAEVLFEVDQRIDVGIAAVGPAVGHEDHGIGALKHHAAGFLVEHLTGNREELELRVEAGNLAELHRHVVEEERALLGRGHRVELAALLVGNEPVKHLDVRGLARERRAIVDDLRLDLPPGEVDHRHGGATITDRLGPGPMKPLIPYFQDPYFTIPGVGLEIHAFGVLVALGFVLGGQVAQNKADKFGGSGDAVNRLIGWLVFGVFVGGH